MYRTATVTAYDCLDQVVVKAVILEYNEVGTGQPPERTEVSSQVRSVGGDDPTIWLWEAVQSLQMVLDSRTATRT